MLRDVFYYGNKPNVHPREKFAASLEDARQQCTTEHFWIINEHCDYRNFDWDWDFDFLPDHEVWAEEHNNVWPSIHQKDSGTWLCPQEKNEIVIYRADVEALRRKRIVSTEWKFVDKIDTNKFDFSWHPDPTDPPYIYVWGNKWNPVQLQPALEYHTPGATDRKYMDQVVELLASEYFVEVQPIDKSKFDMSWRPNPLDPPFIYKWGNKFNPVEMETALEYRCPNATEVKYMKTPVEIITQWDKWENTEHIDKESFDWSWRPDPREPPLIYQFGTQHQRTGGPRYVCDGGRETKYIDLFTAKRLPSGVENFNILDDIVIADFDYSWHPDETEEPFIYVFGNNLYPAEIMPTIEYIVNGATQIKYVNDIIATLGPNKNNWEIIQPINEDTFDFSWKPNPKDPPYIYTWGNKFISNKYKSTIEYHVEGATEIKYMENLVEVTPEWDKWVEVQAVDKTKFDFTWRPDPREPAYIYIWGNKYINGELIPTVEYHCENATEIKYMSNDVCVLPELDRWVIPANIDDSSFDYTWRPDPREPEYIYEFGTQWQKTGGPKYIVPGATEVKYVDIKAKSLPYKTNFKILDNNVIDDFDYSWHPDDTEQPFIYVFGNNQHPAEIMPTIEYAVPGATQIKYVNDVVATLGANKNNWEIPNDVDVTDFDFSWVPNPKDPEYIYEFGTQWQPTGGPKYLVPGATETKYVDTLKARALSNKSKWSIPKNIDEDSFDYSWHPDATSPPYIYRFSTQWAMSGGPTYTVDGATEVKYVDVLTAKAVPDKTNWYVPPYIDSDSFDFSWHPYVEDEPYIYQFGTQWQKTGGPRYLTPGIHNNSAIKYIDTRIIKAKRLPNKNEFTILNDIVVDDFDYTWHPDTTEEPFIYVFGNNQHPAEIMPTIEYVVPGATQIKYVNDVVAKLGVNRNNWIIHQPIDETKFDFIWVPNPKDPPYIYVWGNKYIEATLKPTIEYHVLNATEYKYMENLVEVTPEWDKWEVPKNIDSTNFDFTWRPDPREPPAIYQFGTQWQKTGGPIYKVKGAIEINYLHTQRVKILTNKENWTIPNNIDTSNFDFSWHPDATDDPFIYQFGTQWQKTGGPKYIVDGATEVKYITGSKAKILPNRNNWEIPDNVIDFDFSWHPDATEDPYIYEFGTQWHDRGGPKYVPDAIPRSASGKSIGQIKYINDIVATLGKNKTNWNIPDDIDTTDFDFSWVPHPNESPYIYQFGTQWQKTGGPNYVVDGATEVKYVDLIKAKALPNKNNWSIPKNIDEDSFDYSWHPDDTSPPYIYRFPTQWAMSGGPTYTVLGASEIKYVDDTKAKALPNRVNWDIPDYIDSDSFDFSWHPYVEDEPYIYQFGTQWQKTGGPRYLTPGIHNNSAIKYIDTRIIKAKRLPSKKGFLPPENFKIIADFDYSWHPDDTEPPYIYHFGTQHQRTGGPRYFVDGGTEIKYVDKPKATVLSKDDTTNWEVPKNIDVSNFDFSWHPNEIDEPYIYQFGTQWQKTGGPKYIVPNATEIKYVENSKAKSLPNKENWVLPDDLIIADFDFSWHPDETEEPFLYHFGTQWSEHGGPTYVRLGATVGVTATKYINPRVLKATVAPDKKYWIIPDDIDGDTFDFSWHPHPNSPPYIYQFGTQHQKTGGPQYVHRDIPKMTSGKPIGEISYVDTRVLASTKLPSDTHWVIPDNIDVSRFDFSWHPDDTSPPTTYQFGTLLDKEDGPKYVHPSTMDDVVVFLERIESKQVIVETIVQKDFPKYTITSTLEDLINQHVNELFWALNPDLDYSEFDFDWRPNIEQSQYLHAFGSPENINTQTYFVNAAAWLKGSKDINYVEDKTLNVKVNIDMFFVDRSNSESQSRFEKLKNKFPNIQKTRYLNSWVETINRCINRASSNLCWILNSELDYSDFDFNYYPNPWQMKMVHVFGTQWSHWGTTFMVNRDTFAQDTKFIKIIEHLSNLNFVKERRAKATNILYDTVYIDHGNKDMSRLQKEGKLVIKYQNSYITTFQKMLDMLPTKKEHYIWVVSSICDYAGFDFTYICDPFAKDQLHVFPSDRQKFGDTFLVDVNKLRELIEDMNSLEDYIKINYNQSQRVARLSPPVIVTEGDTHLSSINTEFDFPYAVFVTDDNRNINVVDTEPMSLWSPESKNIQVTSIGGTRIVVPKEAKDFIETQLYDYPYIKSNNRLSQSMPLDIVFFSNGEGAADKNYAHLLEITKGLPNRLTRVDGVQGRVNSQHAAANASKTSWYFLVNGKLKVSQKFDFNWQPDRLQLPKHYIFQATNPVNGLKYGHQAIVANNKRLTLENYGSGLDFTMDSDHEIVKINSGMAIFNTSEWDTWRTAFRECIKLKASDTEENKERLEFWLTVAMGDFAQYSIEGAQHAVEYYDEVNGDFDKLRLSYDWAWLRTYYETKYKL
jgi:hypothetical protein